MRLIWNLGGVEREYSLQWRPNHRNKADIVGMMDWSFTTIKLYQDDLTVGPIHRAAWIGDIVRRMQGKR